MPSSCLPCVTCKSTPPPRDSSCSVTRPHARSRTCHDKALQLFHPISKLVKTDMAAQLPFLFMSTFLLHVSSPRLLQPASSPTSSKFPCCFQSLGLPAGSCNVQSAPLQPATRQVSSLMPLLRRQTYSSPFSMQSWQLFPHARLPIHQLNPTSSLRKPSFHVSSRQSPSPHAAAKVVSHATMSELGSRCVST